MKNTIELYKNAKKELNSGNLDKALELTNKINKTPETASMIGCLLVDIGSLKHNIKMIKDGIAYFEENPKENYYNIANAYFALLKIEKKNYRIDLNDISFFKIKKYYKKVLNQNNEVLINLANTYNFLGRYLEALEYYNIVLQNNPNESRALINKGIVLYNNRFLLKDQLPIIQEAHSCLKEGLKDDNLSFDFKKSAKCYIKKIEKSLNDKPIPKKEEKNNYFTDFIKKYKLYLNPAIHSKNYPIGDSLIIKKPSDEESKYEYLLLSYLNIIKNEYIVNRHILAFSRNKDLLLADENFTAMDNLECDVHQTQVQLLKNCYKNFYKLFDKITFFINSYYKFEISDTSFNNFWYSKYDENPKKRIFNPKLVRLNNKGFFALFDIHRDFVDGEYGYLMDIEDDLVEEELFDNTIKLAQILRSAIIYLIVLIYIEEVDKINHRRSLELIAKIVSND